MLLPRVRPGSYDVGMTKTRFERSGWLVASTSGIGALLLPKCPLCLAGYLSVVGIGVGGIGASALSGLRVALGVLAFLAGIALVSIRLRQRAHACCSGEGSA